MERGLSILEDYPIGDLSNGPNIFIRPSEKRAPRYDENTGAEDKKYGRWVGFATDIDPVTADREKLARQFRNRWRVETQYRQFKLNSMSRRSLRRGAFGHSTSTSRSCSTTSG